MSFFDKLLYKFFKIEAAYSQTGEDKILKHLFDNIGKLGISYLDIGANHPIMNNNTYLFYRRGGHGVCVEPNPELCKTIQKARPRDKCLNIGVSANEDSVAEFYSMNPHTLSTFSKEDAIALDEIGKFKIKKVLKIPVKNINNIIRENFIKPIDLVSIDVEGWNTEIIQSFDFAKNRPFCFCVETLTFSQFNNPEKLVEIFKIFQNNGYKQYADTYLNTIFVNSELHQF